MPLVHNTAGPPTRLEVRVGGLIIPWVTGRDINPQTVRSVSQIAIREAPMVFVGYGVAAPERGWDDFKGFDLHDKVAVFLVNDPDFEANPGEPVAGKFGGRAMTYYGRWTYKFEEAARRGAIAAMVIHENAGAGYGWNVVSSDVGGTYDVVRSADQAQAVLMHAWIARETRRQSLLEGWARFRGLEAQGARPGLPSDRTRRRPLQHRDAGHNRARAESERSRQDPRHDARGRVHPVRCTLGRIRDRRS